MREHIVRQTVRLQNGISRSLARNKSAHVCNDYIPIAKLRPIRLGFARGIDAGASEPLTRRRW
jgi:hypothetical protein